MHLLGLVFLTLLALANLTGTPLAQTSCAGVHIQVLNIKNSAGTIGCALFDSPAGFPRDYLRFANRVMVMKNRDAQARCDFGNLPKGKYAVAVIHDENMNGKFDTNKLGVPTEGFGFSNDPEVFGSPSFSAASFYYDGSNMDLSIRLRY